MPELTAAEVKALVKKRPRGGRINTELFAAMCKANGIPAPEAEFRFHRGRRWRFDFAWPASKLSLEIQGGLFIQGRHSRGAALLKEHEKLNAAACLGWRVLFCTPAEVESGVVFFTIREALAT